MAAPLTSFQHTAARRRLGYLFGAFSFYIGFNTQPPEGGWLRCAAKSSCVVLFQHTAARRRLAKISVTRLHLARVSTHSRPKAAGVLVCQVIFDKLVSTHSRPKAAGLNIKQNLNILAVSTHSRPKAAGNWAFRNCSKFAVSTHSRPKAAGFDCSTHSVCLAFQHTAARRRLGDNT